MPESASPLRCTALHILHQELGGRMVPFAGWSMPVQYPTGVAAEHLHCRAAASLFDVSHMAQLSLRSADGTHAVLAALESVIPADLIGLAPFQQRYGLLTTQSGGIRDDCMVTRRDSDVFMVVNASNAEADIDYLRAALPPSIAITPLADQSLVALQGPLAVSAIRSLDPAVDSLIFMTGEFLSLDGIDCFTTRSGYTGEDGFEISVPTNSAEHLARFLLNIANVAPAGLGARDTLRLEAGLCLHGHDISLDTSPIEAALTWAIPKVRRAGGERAGCYPGAEIIEHQLTSGPTRRRVGLTSDERVPVREGATIVNHHGVQVGRVTSGTVTPTLGRPIAMAYLDTELATASAAAPTKGSVFAEVRGKQVLMAITTMPFVPHKYVRRPSVRTPTTSTSPDSEQS